MPKYEKHCPPPFLPRSPYPSPIHKEHPTPKPLSRSAKTHCNISHSWLRDDELVQTSRISSHATSCTCATEEPPPYESSQKLSREEVDRIKQPRGELHREQSSKLDNKCVWKSLPGSQGGRRRWWWWWLCDGLTYQFRGDLQFLII